MKTYTIKITARDGQDSINTLLTNTSNGHSIEERWTREGNEWIWQDGWTTDGSNQPGLYAVLNESVEKTDYLLNALVLNRAEQINFNV